MTEHIGVQVDGDATRLVAAFSRAQAAVVSFNQGLQLVERVAGAAASAIEAVLETTDKFRRMEIQLTTLTGSVTAARASMDKLIQLAKESPLTLETMTRGFVRLEAGGLRDPLRTLNALNNAVAAFGGSDLEFQRATIALQQMSGKGVISMEELRQQLGEAIPTAMKVMAREMGMSMAEFSKAVASGSVDAEVGIAALTRGLEKDFAGASQRMMNTWAGATSNLKDSWDQFLRAIGESGILDLAITAVQAITSAVNGLTAALREYERWSAKYGGAAGIGRTVYNNPLPGSAPSSMGGIGGDAARTGGDIMPARPRPIGEWFQGRVTTDLEAYSSVTRKQAEIWQQERFAADQAKSIDWEAFTGASEKQVKMWDAARQLADQVKSTVAGGDLEAFTPATPEQVRTWRMARDAEGGFDLSGLFNSKAAEGAALNFGATLGGRIAGVGGAVSGFQSGGPLGAAAGFFADLLLRNEKMQALITTLNTTLAELVGPIADALAPTLRELVPLLQDLAPVFEAVAAALRLYLAPLTAELRFLRNPLENLRKAIDVLTGVIAKITGAFSGGPSAGGVGFADYVAGFAVTGVPGVSIGGGGVTVGGHKIFDDGGVVGPADGFRLAGLPGHRLVAAKLGERFIMPGQGAVAEPTTQVIINGVTSPRETAAAVGRELEARAALRRFRLAPAGG